MKDRAGRGWGDRRLQSIRSGGNEKKYLYKYHGMKAHGMKAVCFHHAHFPSNFIAVKKKQKNPKTTVYKRETVVDVNVNSQFCLTQAEPSHVCTNLKYTVSLSVNRHNCG